MSVKIPHLVWIKVGKQWFYSWLHGLFGPENSECSFHTKTQIASHLPLGSRELLLINKGESESHCLLWISFPFGPKSEATSKNRDTNHCKSVLIPEINIDTVLFLLLLCTEHTLCAWPFIDGISFTPHHNLWNRFQWALVDYTVGRRCRVSITHRARQWVRAKSRSESQIWFQSWRSLTHWLYVKGGKENII